MRLITSLRLTSPGAGGEARGVDDYHLYLAGLGERRVHAPQQMTPLALGAAAAGYPHSINAQPMPLD
jgi:hypothetical protein